MKMSKATEKDIDAAGDAMSVMNDISSGYYPAREGDECRDTFFDPDEFDHLRKFYDLMNATLNKSAGWPSRVIGGMCYVILYDKNEIVDPDVDTLEIHPRFHKVAEQRDELLAAVKSFYLWAENQADGQSKGGHATFDLLMLREQRDIAAAAIVKAEGGAA
jgi:hypothetical protein